MSDRTAELYVIGFPDGPVKVGWSRDVQARLLAAKRSRAGSAATVIATVSVPFRHAIEAERYAHWLLRAHHFRHEWFSVPADHATTAIEAAACRDYSVVGRIPPVEARGRLAPFPQSMISRFPRDTFERIAAILESGETRSDLVRSATMAELERREAKSNPKAPAKRKRSTKAG